MRLNQKRLFTKRQVELKEESFIYKENSILNQFIEAELPYEELRINLSFKHSSVPLFWLGMTGLSGFFFFATFISKILIPETKADWVVISGLGIATLTFSILSYFYWINEIYIATTKGDLALFRTKSKSIEVDSFIKLLKSTSKKYVTEKYLDKLAGSEELQKERIDWMFEAGFISKQEFDELKNKNYRQQGV